MSYRSTLVETLENRLFLTATPIAIAHALDLPSGTIVTATGDPLSVQARTLRDDGGLLGMPTGADDDFLILSTGNASYADTLVNIAGPQSTDLGDAGADDDTATLSFSLNVPVSAFDQKLRFDFMFLAEMPQFVDPETYEETTYLDTFSITINGVEIALDREGNPIDVNSDLFLFDGSLSTEGTIFDGRTPKLTTTFVIPDGVETLDVVISIADVGDGRYDSAVILDNVRFEQTQLVYVDFDGEDVGAHFGYGTQTTIPAFTTDDVRSNGNLADAIAAVMARLQTNYADYNISFTTTKPVGVPFTTIVVGGSVATAVHIDPILQKLKGLAANSSLGAIGFEGMLGLADGVDIGNVNPSNLAVVLAGESQGFGDAAITHLANIISHELGHTLGLRHVADSNETDLMKNFAPLDVNGAFGNTDVTLGENWMDGAETQNDDQYLANVLGLVGDDSMITLCETPDRGIFVTPVNVTFTKTLYNVTFVTSSGIVHLDRLLGMQHVALPVFGPDEGVTVYASTSKTGTINIVSGTPTPVSGTVADPTVPIVGTLDEASAVVALFATDGELLGQIPLSQLLSSGKFRQISKRVGGVQANVPLNLADSLFFSPQGITWATGRATIIDQDGDTITVRISGGGSFNVLLDDADGDGEGAISQIITEGNTARTSLSVSVRRSQAGDGLVDIGEIIGSTFRSIQAKQADIVARGVQVAGWLGGLRIANLFEESLIIAGGLATQRTSLRVDGLIDDATAIQIDSKISSLRASSVGQTEIYVPAISRLTVDGDFQGDMLLGGDGSISRTLGSATIAGDITGGTWTITTGTVGTVTVKGAAVDWTFKSYGNVSRMTFEQLIGSNVYVGVHESFAAIADSDDRLPNDLADFDPATLSSLTVKGPLGVPAAGFLDSVIAAKTIGKLKLSGFDGDNEGTLFGVAADTISSLTSLSPILSLRKLSAAQIITDQDFRVLVL